MIGGESCLISLPKIRTHITGNYRIQIVCNIVIQLLRNLNKKLILCCIHIVNIDVKKFEYKIIVIYEYRFEEI